MRRTPIIPVAFAAAALAATAFAAPAHAAEPEQVAGGLFGVLSVAVAEDGTVYATQSMDGQLMKIAPGGEPEVIFADEGGREVSGLSVVGDVITFTATSQGGPANARIYTYTPAEGGGFDQVEIADTWAFEKKNNPDGNRTYGVAGLSKSCVKSIPKEARAGVAPYKGIKESHPYATTTAGDVTYVADAAANAILAVEDGAVSTVAVLPPVKVKVTKQLRKAMDLPKCVQGKTYKGEPVPTDVEVDADGNLVVTTLGGGAGEVLPLGAIYEISPAGKVRQQTDGLSMPVGVAIGSDGATYVSVMGMEGGVLKNPDPRSAELVVTVPLSGDVDVHDEALYVTRTGLDSPPEGPPTGGVFKVDLAVG